MFLLLAVVTPSFAGTLTGSADPVRGSVNLSAEGSTDWVHWGSQANPLAVVRKAGVASSISNLVDVAGSPRGRRSATVSYAWSDGAPTANATAVRRGVRMVNVGVGASFTVAAGTEAQELKIYVGAYGALGTLSASLSDGSAADFSIPIDGANGKTGQVVTIAFQADADNQTLTVRYQVDQHYAMRYNWISLEAAALQAGAGEAGVGGTTPSGGKVAGTIAATPTTVNLSGEGSADWIHWGRTADPRAATRKAGVTAQLGNWTSIGGTTPLSLRSANGTAYRWTGGTPTASATVTRGVRMFDEGRGLSFTADADTDTRTLKVYIGALRARARLTATLSDRSAAPHSTVIEAPAGQLSRVVTIAYNAASAKQELTVKLEVEQHLPGTRHWVMLEAATLQGGTVTTPPTEPETPTPPPTEPGTPPPVSGDNVVPNASFEANSGWERVALADYSTAQSRTGGRSLQLINNGNGKSGTHQAIQRNIKGIVGGQEYVATVWVRGQGVTGAHGPGDAPLLVLGWHDSAGAPVEKTMYDWAPLGTYDWKQLRIHVQAPEKASQLSVAFRSWWLCLDGTTYWDDVSLTPRTFPDRGAKLAAYQAENADTRSGGGVKSSEGDFSGSGYFDVTTNKAVLEWKNVTGGGRRVISMRYAWEGAAKGVELIVNGVSQGMKYPLATGRRGNYASEDWTVNLPSGNNTVRLIIGKGNGGEKIQPQIDRIDVYAAR